MLVRVLVEAVEQRRALARRERLAMQQRRGRLDRRRVAAIQDLWPVEAQQPVVGPLEAVEEQPVVGAHQDHEPRRVVCAEDTVREPVGPGRFGRVRGWRTGNTRQINRLLEQVAFGFRPGDRHHQQTRAAAGAGRASLRPDADGITVGKRHRLRRDLVAERAEQQTLQCRERLG